MADRAVKPKLGYVGLGLMGQPMTRHLVGKGYACAATILCRRG